MATGNSPTVAERTRAKADPIRNFKFQVQFFSSGEGGDDSLADIGFVSVEGLGMSTEVMTYREGGWNTNPHKLPGMSDFPPLTCSSGVFARKPGIWRAAKKMFAAQWGSGSLEMGEDFRFDLAIRVLDHPVTKDAPSGSRGTPEGAVLGFKVYNGWIANVNFSGLDATTSGLLVHQMTIHHEGLEVVYGASAADGTLGATSSVGGFR